MRQQLLGTTSGALLSLLLGFSLVSCGSDGSSAKDRTIDQGKLTVGPGGPIVGGEIIAKCTEPPPSYYSQKLDNTLEVLLKLKTIELGNLKDEFHTNLETFRNNTAAGADLQSVLFYTCQTSTTRGLSEGTTKELMELAIKAWAPSH